MASWLSIRKLAAESERAAEQLRQLTQVKKGARHSSHPWQRLPYTNSSIT